MPLRIVAAVAVSLSLAAGPASGEASADTGPYAETVIPATMRSAPGFGSVTSVGPSGFLHWEPATSPPSGMVWTGLDGTSRRLEGTSSADPIEYYGAASDVVARRSGSRDVVLRNMVTDETTTVTIPAGQTYSRTIGTTVVTTGGPVADHEWAELHLLDNVNGTTVDRRVTGLPDGSSVVFLRRAGLHGFLVSVRIPGQTLLAQGWIDLHTAQAALPQAGTLHGDSVVTADHLVTPTAEGVRVYEQGRFDAPVRVVDVDMKDARVLGVVGDSLILGRYDSSFGSRTQGAAQWKVVAAPFDGSGERTLLARAVSDRIAIRPDGGVQLVGGQSAEDYGYQAVTAGPDGAPQVTRVLRIPPVPMQIQRLTLDHRTVRTLEYGDGRTRPYDRQLAEGAPGFGERTVNGSLPTWHNKCSPYEGTCPELYPTGDGRTVYRGVSDNGDWKPQLFVVGKGEAFPGTPRATGLQDSTDDSDPQTRILGASGNLVLLAGTPVDGSEELRVLDIDSGKVLHKEPYRQAALWGTTLWTGTRNGTMTAKDARTGAALTHFTMRSQCTELVDLEAVGRWVYWKCYLKDAPYVSGVYDVEARKNIAVPAGQQAYLGDGVVAVQDAQGLGVHDLRTGTAVRRATLGGRAALDPRTGDLAYVAAGESVHVVHLGRPAAALVSPYRHVGSQVETDATPLSWRGEWWLSEPAGSWTVEIRRTATGRVVATRGGGPAEYSIATSWDGRDTTGGLLPNGSYTWRLTAQPADGQGAALVRSGTVRLTGGTAVWRDHVGAASLPDAVGDLVTTTSSGVLGFHPGDGAGKFSTTVSTSGWPASARVVPFGDLSGDRCADVLVRPGDGSLRLYRPACGTVPKPASPYTVLGTGWHQYDVLASPGDVSGDGRPDLIARHASTGTVYLYQGTGTGKLAARVKLYDNWKTYKKIVGAGDLDGDGVGDLLAQDAHNTLYRYSGTGDGTFSSPVRLFTGWGGTYDSVVGVGDITGDGKADLVARDTAGAVYRQSGDGRGTFGSRVRIATGWHGYKGIF
jgi:hypothetical protein